MRSYHQLTSEERYALSTLRRQGCTQAEITRALGRHRSTVSREVRRNSKDRTGRVYRPGLADDLARWRRSRSRRNQRFTAEDWAVVLTYLNQHWSPEQISGRLKIDTVIGTTKPCVVTLVERTTGLLMIGKMKARTVAELNRAAVDLIASSPLPVHTITADNGTEFHGYRLIEEATNTRFYFATPHHSWERGSNENANGLIR